MYKYLLILLCIPVWMSAQKKPTKIRHVHSDKIQKIPGKYQGNLLFSGNVTFEHNGSVLKADSVAVSDTHLTLPTNREV